VLTTATIASHARQLGFDLCGVAAAASFPELAHLKEWLSRGYGGEMAYLHKTADTRADIRQFLPSARSVIVTGTVYYTDAQSAGHGEPPRAPAASPAIARYAWGEDYHVVLAARLGALINWMREQHDEPFDAAIFVDKHHVQERVYAKHAGIGWIGKNTCVIHPEIGSWMLLAGVAVSLDLVPDAPMPDQCGACTLCIDSCPTGAIVDEHEVDATRCISYLTIEIKGSIPEEQRGDVGQHVFGCDICQEVCPYNLAPLATIDPAWQPRGGRHRAEPVELWRRRDHELHALVQGSAMMRTSLSQLRRNLAVVIGNNADPRAASALDSPGGGVPHAAQSAETPLVREHAAWARNRLAAAKAEG